MTDPAPPAFVTKRDGRLVPFEADRISRALFAATESLGRPDAFLARELADGAVHFLAQDSEGQTPTTARIAEVVAQVVRELGDPALAVAFAAHHKAPTSLQQARREHTLAAVYTRDLTAAQEAGLITLTDFDAPELLAARVLDHPADVANDARLVAIDGLDYLAAMRGVEGQIQTDYLHNAVVNLNSAEPPHWAEPIATGPLFAAQPIDAVPHANHLLEALCSTGVRIDWHLGARDFAPEQAERLHRVIALARHSRVRFVFDRPRRPVALAEGLDRRQRAVLLYVWLHLPALAHQGGLLADSERFVQRLGSLARLALSAAVQKRDYLRRRVPELARGFLLDRARLVVVPVGLDEVVRLYTEWGLANGGPSLEFGRRIVTRLRDVLRQDGRSAQMEACIDGPAWSEERQRERMAGLTPVDDTASAESQLRAAGVLHALTEAGTLVLRGESDNEALFELLHQAWRRTEVVRLTFFRGPKDDIHANSVSCGSAGVEGFS